MKLRKDLYQNYLQILTEELIPAQGCTEPIAIAYAAAVAAKTLGEPPERMRVEASGNLIKNVKGVFIPHGGNLKGVEASAVLGALGGDPDQKLEVLTDMTPEIVERARQLLCTDFCSVALLEGAENLHLIVEIWGKTGCVLTELAHTHTNIVRVEKNGKLLYGTHAQGENGVAPSDRSQLNVAQILAFADECDLRDVREIIDRQIEYNVRIAQEGLRGDWGMSVGKMLYQNGQNRCSAYAAAASDARMSGCEMPVVIVSGSGNQGATASLPVIIYAREHSVGHDRLVRALVLSNLIAIHQKTGIGRLSAYCGAVSAAVGSAAAMAYLDGGSQKQIEDTITNTIANVSGMVCDGAKPSCAAKIASAVEAALLGHDLAMSGHVFEPGTGIVKSTVEKTISAVGRIAREGMRSTDVEILHCMIENV